MSNIRLNRSKRIIKILFSIVLVLINVSCSLLNNEQVPTGIDIPVPDDSNSCSYTKPLNNSKNSDRDNLLLFVHGFNGSAEDTWEKFPEFIAADKDLSHTYDISFFCYPSHLFKSGSPTIKDLARTLKTEITNRYKDYKNISIVSHSTGGLIAREYILDQVKRETPIAVKHLALYAVPNSGTDLAKIWKYCFPRKQATY